MKAVLAIICSLVLIGTPFLSQATLPCANPMASNCCGGGGKMSCCAAKAESQSVPAQTGAQQNQILLLATDVVIWTLPENPANPISSVPASPSTATGVALYAQNCALLL